MQGDPPKPLSPRLRRSDAALVRAVLSCPALRAAADSLVEAIAAKIEADSGEPNLHLPIHVAASS